MDNEFKVSDSAGNMVTGDYDTKGFAISLELGKRFHANKETKSGWYVEPQIQISRSHQNGDSFTASNGLSIGVDSYNSVLGRVGILAGYEFNDKKKPVNLYAKVSRVKEFDGDINITANGAKISDSFEDSWWVYGLGVTAKVNDKHSLYLDVERASGGFFKEPWSVKGDWRMTF